MVKIVLADDDPTMVYRLTTFLKMDDFEVRNVDDHEDVASIVKHELPDFLILDFHLSNPNGLDILDHIQDSYPAKNPRTIMISALNLKEECVRHSADDFLLKPFMPAKSLNLDQNNGRSS